MMPFIMTSLVTVLITDKIFNRKTNETTETKQSGGGNVPLTLESESSFKPQDYLLNTRRIRQQVVDPEPARPVPERTFKPDSPVESESESDLESVYNDSESDDEIVEFN
jgi:hypothetical protein